MFVLRKLQKTVRELQIRIFCVCQNILFLLSILNPGQEKIKHQKERTSLTPLKNCLDTMLLPVREPDSMRSLPSDTWTWTGRPRSVNSSEACWSTKHWWETRP